MPGLKAQDILNILNNNENKVLLAGTCFSHQSGCHCFTQSLHQEFPHVDHTSIAFGDYSIEMKQKNHNTYTHVVFSGCGMDMKHLPTFLEKLFPDEAETSRNNRNIILILPPHFLPGGFTNESPSFSSSQYSSCLSAYKKLSIVLTHPIIDNEYSIGFPSPVFDTAILEKTPLPYDDFHGLLYIPHSMTKDDKDLKPETILYLELFFSTLSKVAPCGKNIQCMILGIKENQSMLIDAINEAADSYFLITPVFIKNRLSPEEFQAAIYAIKKEGGLIGTNGIQTMIQSILLGANVFIIRNMDNNFGFYNILPTCTAKTWTQYEQFCTILGANKNINKTQVSSLTISDLNDAVTQYQILFKASIQLFNKLKEHYYRASPRSPFKLSSSPNFITQKLKEKEASHQVEKISIDVNTTRRTAYNSNGI